MPLRVITLTDTIIGNCDTLLFLDIKEKTMLKEVEELLGRADGVGRTYCFRIMN